MKGLQRACEKLAVPLESIEEAVANVEAKVRGGGQGEVPTSIIGEYAAEELRKIDKVAYVRFASVYREFTDISCFTHEIAKLLEDKEAHRNGK